MSEIPIQTLPSFATAGGAVEPEVKAGKLDEPIIEQEQQEQQDQLHQQQTEHSMMAENPASVEVPLAQSIGGDPDNSAQDGATCAVPREATPRSSFAAPQMYVAQSVAESPQHQNPATAQFSVDPVAAQRQMNSLAAQLQMQQVQLQRHQEALRAQQKYLEEQQQYIHQLCSIQDRIRHETPEGATRMLGQRDAPVGRPNQWNYSAAPSIPAVSLASPKSRLLPKEQVEKLTTWLNDHILHPYPTKEELMQLVRETCLTEVQVTNWFNNARRRHKNLFSLPERAVRVLHAWFRAHIANPYPSPEQVHTLCQQIGLNITAATVDRWIAHARTLNKHLLKQVSAGDNSSCDSGNESNGPISDGGRSMSPRSLATMSHMGGSMASSAQTSRSGSIASMTHAAAAAAVAAASMPMPAQGSGGPAPGVATDGHGDMIGMLLGLERNAAMRSGQLDLSAVQARGYPGGPGAGGPAHPMPPTLVRHPQGQGFSMPTMQPSTGSSPRPTPSPSGLTPSLSQLALVAGSQPQTQIGARSQADGHGSGAISPHKRKITGHDGMVPVASPVRPPSNPAAMGMLGMLGMQPHEQGIGGWSNHHMISQAAAAAALGVVSMRPGELEENRPPSTTQPSQSILDNINEAAMRVNALMECEDDRMVEMPGPAPKRTQTGSHTAA